MKSRIIKIIEAIFIILIVTNTVLAISNTCQATTDITEDIDFWKPDAYINSTSEELDKKIGIIVGWIMIVGILTSVATLSVIGIKFMIASVEQKAQYKQTLFPWLIGAVLVFSLTALPTFIYNIVNDANKIEEVQISIDKSNINLKLGEVEEATLNATVTSNKERIVRWTTSNSNIATVDRNGKVTAKAEGTAIIKAFTSKAEATCKVTVEGVRTTDIAISKNSITLDSSTGISHQLIATVTPLNSKEPVYWSSSDNMIATVRDGKVIGVSSGTAIITATSGEKSATCTVYVEGSRVYELRYYNQSTDKVSTMRTSSDDLAFWIYIPDILKLSTTDKLSLIVFLHGSGERGENPQVLKNLAPFYLQDKDYKAIVIYPQCPSQLSWVKIHQKIKGLIDYSIENYNVDENKIALTGFSLGGSGAWDIGIQYPTLFSCLVIVSGYSSISANVYPDCPVVAIGSTEDGTETHMTTIGSLLKKAGKKVKVTKYSEPHQKMQRVAYTPTLIEWMIERSRKTNSSYQF